jgi:uncharacterized protein YrrD
MFCNTHDIIGLDIQATDGRIGDVEDLYFDDHEWGVRYLVADTGQWLPGRNALLSPDSVTQVDRDNGAIAMALTTSQIEQAPGVETDMPVSRKREKDLARHFGWGTYWDTASWGNYWGPIANPNFSPLANSATGQDDASAESADPNLRSCREVEGYDILARDGEIGHVERFLLEVDTWVIRYLVVDTRNWLPGRTVLVSPMWLKSIDWTESRVLVDVDREAIESSPQYDPKTGLTRGLERKLHDHFGQVKYWEN